MLLRALFLIPIIFAAPLTDMVVTWTSSAGEALKITVQDRDNFLEQCVKGGLEVRYRYEMKLCKRRTLWYDGCSEKLSQVHTLQFDPISESYRVIADRVGDTENPITTTFESLDEAYAAVATIKELPLTALGYVKGRIPAYQMPYVGIRVRSDCKGEHSKSLMRISSFLTLGLINLHHYDSGWVDFSVVR